MPEFTKCFIRFTGYVLKLFDHWLGSCDTSCDYLIVTVRLQYSKILYLGRYDKICSSCVHPYLVQHQDLDCLGHYFKERAQIFSVFCDLSRGEVDGYHGMSRKQLFSFQHGQVCSQSAVYKKPAVHLPWLEYSRDRN
ncbi:hypothetical protein SDC9_152030 [bioreactor metagenome]|uniref:Uncharacterized protein n=1 Tax=bioreactor metagenome TaxID=1076179 RepID=A0A645EWA6_9ZZZZ